MLFLPLLIRIHITDDSEKFTEIVTARMRLNNHSSITPSYLADTYVLSIVGLNWYERLEKESKIGNLTVSTLDIQFQTKLFHVVGRRDHEFIQLSCIALKISDRDVDEICGRKMEDEKNEEFEIKVRQVYSCLRVQDMVTSHHF